MKTNNNTNNKNEIAQKGLNPVAVGAIGAGIAVAAGTAIAVLSDKKRRHKIAKALEDMNMRVRKFVDRAGTIARRAGRVLEEEKRKIPVSSPRRRTLAGA